jgi:hypothetical protein
MSKFIETSKSKKIAVRGYSKCSSICNTSTGSTVKMMMPIMLYLQMIYFIALFATAETDIKH